MLLALLARVAGIAGTLAARASMEELLPLGAPCLANKMAVPLTGARMCMLEEAARMTGNQEG